jgi:hypothetical protein
MHTTHCVKSPAPQQTLRRYITEHDCAAVQKASDALPKLSCNVSPRGISLTDGDLHALGSVLGSLVAHSGHRRDCAV